MLECPVGGRGVFRQPRYRVVGSTAGWLSTYKPDLAIMRDGGNDYPIKTTPF